MTRITIEGGTRKLQIETSAEHDLAFLIRESLAQAVVNFRNMEMDVTMIPVQQSGQPNKDPNQPTQQEPLHAYGFPIPERDDEN